MSSQSSHFMLLILNVPQWELLILDPSDMPSSGFHLSASYFVVTTLKNIMYVRDPERVNEVPVPQCYVAPKIPRQLSASDSGVWVCKFMDFFTRGLDLTSMQWDQEHNKALRSKIAYELVRKEKACRL